jgi:orotate phosphoribosyltransferase
MKLYQQKFIELALQHQALLFGEFTLKSGRISPYFFNMGKLSTSMALKTLGECYAALMQEMGSMCDVLFGPAYKGIPLACTTAIALATQYQIDMPYAFNRKEIKDHGEGGSIIGAPLNQRVYIVDDVITAGTAIREALQLIQAAQGKATGIIVALDRQEKGEGTLSALQEIENTFSVPVRAIITLETIMEFVKNSPELHAFQAPMQAYRQRYGISAT